MAKTSIQLSPTASDDAGATKQGTKEYFHGTTYNSGITIGIALGTNGGSAISSVDYGIYIPYQTQAGNWRLKFNVRLNVPSTTRTAQSFTITGITSGRTQTFTGMTGSTGTTCTGLFEHTADEFIVSHASTAQTIYMISGDLSLDAKPTWAF